MLSGARDRTKLVNILLWFYSSCLARKKNMSNLPVWYDSFMLNVNTPTACVIQ